MTIQTNGDDLERKNFERWWEIRNHNGKPPRFGWDYYRDGEGYSDDEFQTLWEVWQVAIASKDK